MSQPDPIRPNRCSIRYFFIRAPTHQLTSVVHLCHPLLYPLALTLAVRLYPPLIYPHALVGHRCSCARLHFWPSFNGQQKPSSTHSNGHLPLLYIFPSLRLPFSPPFLSVTRSSPDLRLHPSSSSSLSSSSPISFLPSKDEILSRSIATSIFIVVFIFLVVSLLSHCRRRDLLQIYGDDILSSKFSLDLATMMSMVKTDSLLTFSLNSESVVC
ncbi:hypothetical protein ACLOJK_037595 [Asimina triloba]